MNIAQTFLNWSWWVYPRSGINPFWLWVNLAVPVGLILTAGLLKKFIRPRLDSQKRLLNSWIKLILYCAAASFMVLFFRWQALPVLGTRIWNGVIVVVFTLIGLWLIFSKHFILPDKIAKEETQDYLAKYLPRPKTK